MVGRAFPKTPTLYNDVVRHYDKGDQRREHFIHLEGNCSVLTEAFRDVGGFQTHLPTHEGAELSLRLVTRYGKGSFVYDPNPAILHDHATTLCAFVSKRLRVGRGNRELARQMPEVLCFMSGYPEPSRHRTPGRSLGRRLLCRCLRLLGHCLKKIGAAGVGG